MKSTSTRKCWNADLVFAAHIYTLTFLHIQIIAKAVKDVLTYTKVHNIIQQIDYLIYSRNVVIYSMLSLFNTLC